MCPKSQAPLHLVTSSSAREHCGVEPADVESDPKRAAILMPGGTHSLRFFKSAHATPACCECGAVSMSRCIRLVVGPILAIQVRRRVHQIHGQNLER